MSIETKANETPVINTNPIDDTETFNLDDFKIWYDYSQHWHRDARKREIEKIISLVRELYPESFIPGGGSDCIQLTKHQYRMVFQDLETGRQPREQVAVAPSRRQTKTFTLEDFHERIRKELLFLGNEEASKTKQFPALEGLLEYKYPKSFKGFRRGRETYEYKRPSDIKFELTEDQFEDVIRGTGAALKIWTWETSDYF